MYSTGSSVYYISIFNGLYWVQNAPQGITPKRLCITGRPGLGRAPGSKASAVTPHSGCSQSMSVSQQMVKTLFYLLFNKPSVQSLSRVRFFTTPWTAAHQASLSITNSQSLLKLPSNHLILCHPLLLLPSIFPSIRVFSNESVLRIRWPKY